MAKYGTYETRQRIARSALVGTWKLADPAAPADVGWVVHQFEPVAGVLGVQALGRHRAGFAARYGLQKKLAEGSSAWAKVQRCEALDGNPYCIAEYFPYSMRDVLRLRMAASPRDLSALVQVVLQGLGDLKKSDGRSHGNLSAGTVLLLRLSPEKGRIGLTEMAWDTAVNGSEGSDLQALGQIIHEWVVGRQYVHTAAGMARAPEWDKLGEVGQAWREFCGYLLNAARGGEPAKIEEALARLPKEGPRSRRGWWIGSAAAVLVLVVVLGVMWWVRPRPIPVEDTHREWRALCDADENFLEPIRALSKSKEFAVANGSDRQKALFNALRKAASIKAPGELCKEATHWPNKIAWGIESEDGKKALRSISHALDDTVKDLFALEKTLASEVGPKDPDWVRPVGEKANPPRCAQDYGNALSAGHTELWEVQTFGKEGRPELKRFVFQTSDKARELRTWLETIRRIDEVDARQKAIRMQGEKVFEEAKVAKAVTEGLGPTLRKFTESFDGAFSGAVSKAGKIEEVADVLQPWEEAGRKLEEKLKPLAADTPWTAENWNVEAWKADNPAPTGVAGVKVYTDWAEAFPSYYVDKKARESDAAWIEEQLKGFAEIKQRINDDAEARPHAGEADPALTELGRLKAAMGMYCRRHIPLTEKNKADLVAAYGKLEDYLQWPASKLAREVRAHGVVAAGIGAGLHACYLTSAAKVLEVKVVDLGDEGTLTASLSAKYGAKIAAKICRGYVSRMEELRTKEASVQQDAAANLERVFVETGPWKNKPGELKSGVLAKWVEGTDLDGVGQRVADFRTRVEPLRVFLAEAGAVLREDPLAYLAPGQIDRDCEWLAKNRGMFGQSELGQISELPVLLAKLDWVKQLWDVKKATPGEVLPRFNKAGGGGLQAYEWAVYWRAMEQDNGKLMASSGELASLAQAEVKIMDGIGKISGAGLNDAGARWRMRFGGELVDEGRIDLALRFCPGYGVAKDAADALVKLPVSPELAVEARFDLLLYKFSKYDIEAAKPGEELKRVKADFIEKLRGLEGQAEEPTKTWISKIRIALEKTKGGDVIGEGGPEKANWVRDKLYAKEDIYVFHNPADASESGELRFKKYKVKGSENAYFICTTSVPLKLAMQLLRGHEDAVKVLQQLPVNEKGDADEKNFTGLGPRVWDWDSAKKNFKTAPSWFGHALAMTNTSPYFDKALGGSPDEMYPMQYVSMELGAYMASRLSCRFPTVKEWQNAFEQENAEPGRVKLVPVLCGAHYKSELDYLTKVWNDGDDELNPLHLLKSGFGDLPAAFAPAGSSDGKVLWFRRVDEQAMAVGETRRKDNPDVVYHLAGNVGQYVLDDNDAQAFSDKPFEKQPDFFRDMGKRCKMKLIGASGLSANRLNDKDIREPIPMDEVYARSGSAMPGFADVGVRVAFTAGDSLKEEILKVVKPEGKWVYLAYGVKR